ncbi:MAG: hypothetical protein EOP47_00465 [Sphingobacteriaceae bacterium]|nr:MAG: hypothetical protein EOP47_00465 [Sphingobacteriaceae bacterium]
MFNLRLTKDYLLYLLKAKTRHGTHSPFVYRLVDKVIYDYSAKKVYDELIKLNAPIIDGHRSNKLNQLIYRLTADWQPATIIELGDPLGITSQYLLKASPEAKIFSENVVDSPGLIFINTNNGQEAFGYFKQCLLKVNSGTLMLINGIYANEGMKAAWIKIKTDHQVTVSINLFWIGLTYFKKDQAKEDFVIKI